MDPNNPNLSYSNLLQQQQLRHWNRQQMHHQLLLQRQQQLQQQQSMSRSGAVDPATRDFSKLTSFLETDHSFFTPWNNPTLDVPDKGKDSKPNSLRKQRMNFEPGSFFAYEVHDLMKLKEQPDPSKTEESNQDEN